MRHGVRLGHWQVVDSMFLDGLEDAYDTGRPMGSFAKDCADRYGFSREAQDDFALTSLSRACAAQQCGAFAAEIAGVHLKGRQTDTVLLDDQPGRARPDRIPTLRPAFREGGTVTAANASSISDGAAALVIAAEQVARARGLTVRARIMGHASHAQAPGLFTTAPVPATQKLLRKLGWAVDDVDLWEVNEAFAVVPMVYMAELGVPHEKLNVNGGACALGHPIGASGARILVTLLHAMEAHSVKKGIAAICIGGGEGTAVAIERD
jgi:acetyl-CoA C-acetyltransferase